eukprot:1137299-Pelagomonas_calceolata.AAC.3
MCGTHERNNVPHHSLSAHTHYLNNLTNKFTINMHKRRKLASANTSGYYFNSWQRPSHAIQLVSPNTTGNTQAHNSPTHLANKEILSEKPKGFAQVCNWNISDANCS